MNMDSMTLLVGLAIFLAVFTQSLSGFGVALVAMALLPALVGIHVATPLVAIVALVLEVVLVLYYRQSLQVRAVWNMALAAVVGTPLGVWFLTRVDERLALTVLGVVIAGYALYASLGLKMPHLEKNFWAYLAGLFGGMLGGAYNTSGPPVIVYADCRRWPPDVFKGNLQGYFIVVSLAVVTSHAINGNFTIQIWQMFLWTLPFIILGIVAGLSLDHWLNPDIFRRVVLILLIVMGIKLMF
jgi:uncharacterized membrane protein YfcA